MRIELYFSLENNILPTDYRRGFLSFFKKSLELYNLDIFNIIYGIGKKKDITFAPFFSLEKFDKNTIFLKKNDIKLIFSTEDQLLGIHFLNAFKNMIGKKRSFFKNSITLKKIKQVKEKEITTNCITFKTLSPIIIREQIDEKKSWYHYLDEKGILILKNNLLDYLRNRFPEKELKEIKIEPISIKKTVVFFYNINMTATLGIIKITADKEILNYFYKSGLSPSKKSAGFGMLDIE